MSSPGSGSVGLALPMFLLGAAITAVVAAVVAIRRLPPRPAPTSAPVTTALRRPPADSIAAEADVFSLRAGMLAIAFSTRREREAHPRTLATYHYLRAYPGAPPRIPHELTPDEFRTSACRTCHDRGGYSRRFVAYVPVTPHPDRGPCLQCHVGVDELMAVPLTSPDPNRRCHQCHGGGGRPRTGADAPLDWHTIAWPPLARVTPDQIPPPIPHGREFRENCLACHSGPAAVAEIRTTHPERADCRGCHVMRDLQALPFARAVSNGGADAGTAP